MTLLERPVAQLDRTQLPIVVSDRCTLLLPTPALHYTLCGIGR